MFLLPLKAKHYSQLFDNKNPFATMFLYNAQYPHITNLLSAANSFFKESIYKLTKVYATELSFRKLEQ